MARHGSVLRDSVQNVRELSDDSLKPRDEETWRVAIDYPFDVDGKTPNDDLARLQDFIATGAQCRTLVWIPAFLSRDSLKDLGTLVILDHPDRRAVCRRVGTSVACGPSTGAVPA